MPPTQACRECAAYKRTAELLESGHRAGQLTFLRRGVCACLRVFAQAGVPVDAAAVTDLIDLGARQNLGVVYAEARLMCHCYGYGLVDAPAADSDEDY